MIQIFPETTKEPLQLIGKTAGICWGSDVSDKEKNKKRAISCINSGHGRVMEWVEVYTSIDGYSSRVIREFERHHVVASFLQESTRYVDCSNFKYVLPPYVQSNDAAKKVYDDTMTTIQSSYAKLLEMGMPQEDAANILPLGMNTKVVDKRNLRNLYEMCQQRLCSRAYWEFRVLIKEYIDKLRAYSDEWAWICDNLFKSKCEFLRYCPEEKSCGKMPKKDYIDFKDSIKSIGAFSILSDDELTKHLYELVKTSKKKIKTNEIGNVEVEFINECDKLFDMSCYYSSHDVVDVEQIENSIFEKLVK